MKLQKITTIFLIILCFMVQILAPLETLAANEEPIRVGFIEGDAFHKIDSNGRYSGFNYDYLMKVAQYTGFKYEFILIEDTVNHTSNELAQIMLKNGDIDLLGSMFKTHENEIHYEFGEKNYGVARHILCALGNNNRITSNTYFLQDEISVALVKDRVNSIEAFNAIFEHSDVITNITYVDTQEEAIELLISENVDTIMSTDVSVNSNILVSLTESTPSPFYFVTSKGNTELLKELDNAISNIELNEFTIQKKISEDYFALLHTGNIILTQQEQLALSDYPYLTVGLLKGREPYQFYTDDNEETPKGISVEILEEISTIIGVDFKYVWLEDREEMKDKIATREIDLCSTVPYDTNYELAYYFDVVLTQPYLTNSIAWVHSKTENREAQPKYYYIADNLPYYSKEELTEIYDIEQAILDIANNRQTSLFADSYMAQYNIQKLGVANVEIQTVTSKNSNICFGVGKHLDSVVVGLINHAMLHVEPYKVDEIIYDNVTVQNNISLRAFLNNNTIPIIFFMIVFFSGITFILYYYTKKFKNLSRQDSLTKLYNAGYFHNYATDKTRKIRNGCLILVDIDYFKQVNDNYGHQTGDTIIITVAKELKESLSKYGTVARLGGDEFVILIENSCEADFIGEKCKEVLENLLQNGTGVKVTLSIGGYIFNKPTPYDDLYRLADEVLYKVKEKGRNGYLFSNEDID